MLFYWNKVNRKKKCNILTNQYFKYLNRLAILKIWRLNRYLVKYLTVTAVNVLVAKIASATIKTMKKEKG